MCGCDCFVSSKSMHSSLLTWRNFFLKNHKDRSKNAPHRRSGKISSHIFETYKNSVQPHGCHIYNTVSDISVAKMCCCTSEHHDLPYWKYVLLCCDKGPIIFQPSQEANKDTTNTCPIIRFNVYHNISRRTVHRLRPYHERTKRSLC